MVWGDAAALGVESGCAEVATEKHRAITRAARTVTHETVFFDLVLIAVSLFIGVLTASARRFWPRRRRKPPCWKPLSDCWYELRCRSSRWTRHRMRSYLWHPEYLELAGYQLGHHRHCRRGSRPYCSRLRLPDAWMRLHLRPLGVWRRLRRLRRGSLRRVVAALGPVAHSPAAWPRNPLELFRHIGSRLPDLNTAFHHDVADCVASCCRRRQAGCWAG